MSALTIMAAGLQRELFNRGVSFLSIEECEEILRKSIDASVRAAGKRKPAALPAKPD